ncbi:MAG: NAD-dependent epimerase/dehydratase family protein [Balneolales bacterium]
MRILVTGSSGYVAGFLIPQLKRQGHYITGFDRHPSPGGQEDSFIRDDLIRISQYGSVLQDVDLVIHLAAAKADWGLTKAEFFRDNKEVTAALLQASAGAGVLNHIFYSTVAVYGPSERPKTEEAPTAPVIAYGESKFECEKLYHAFHQNNPQSRIKVIRPSVIYGPRHPASTNIYRLIDAIYRRRFFMIGRGEAYKTTSYIYNLLDANDLILNRMNGEGIEDFIVTDNPVIQTKELVEMIFRNLKKKGRPLCLPLRLVRPFAYTFDLMAEFTGVDFPITAARIEKFCTSTNFSSAKIVKAGYRQKISNEEAIKETVEWQLENIYGQAPALRPALNG